MPSTSVTDNSTTQQTGGHKKNYVHSVSIAGLKVVHAPEKVRTVLGSCIGIAMYDRAAKVGGLAHIILPCSREGSGDPGKFADSAIDLLVEQLIEAGAQKKRLTAKITGGASMFDNNNRSVGLGQRNEEAVIRKLREHSIRLAASQTGGTKGRKMMLNPATGEVQVEIIGEQPQVI